jgi:hypothetical protein
MVEVSHLKNEPWQKTLAEKGQLSKIDYFLAIDNTEGSLSFEQAKERIQRISEMHKILGTA